MKTKAKLVNDKCLDRQSFISALADNGYTVKVKERKTGLMDIEYYVLVFEKEDLHGT
jgi:hypothetical protein